MYVKAYTSRVGDVVLSQPGYLLKLVIVFVSGAWYGTTTGISPCKVGSTQLLCVTTVVFRHITEISLELYRCFGGLDTGKSVWLMILMVNG